MALARVEIRRDLVLCVGDGLELAAVVVVERHAVPERVFDDVQLVRCVVRVVGVVVERVCSREVAAGVDACLYAPLGVVVERLNVTLGVGDRLELAGCRVVVKIGQAAAFGDRLDESSRVDREAGDLCLGVGYRCQVADGVVAKVRLMALAVDGELNVVLAGDRPPGFGPVGV